LAANFAFLLGCISPATKDLALYRVNVTHLANNLHKLAANDTNNVDALLHPALPKYWYFGLSGEAPHFPCLREFANLSEASSQWRSG
jgi:hypothetical protein